MKWPHNVPYETALYRWRLLDVYSRFKILTRPSYVIWFDREKWGVVEGCVQSEGDNIWGYVGEPLSKLLFKILTEGVVSTEAESVFQYLMTSLKLS